MSKELAFKDRFQLVQWLGDLVAKNTTEDTLEDISSSINETTGLCDLELTFKNGDTAKISVSMEDSNFKSKQE